MNLSIRTNTFPKPWKNAKVAPLYKGKDSNRTSPKSYRPVAILPIASKVLERVIHNQILEHMEKNQFWHPNHHAYRKNRSTETAVIQLYDTWVEAVSEGRLATATLIDMSAAFDTVNIDILLEKLKLYNFGDEATAFMESYLRNRKQLVSIGGSNSKLRDLDCGVPQGSILGPVLYTLYTNDFPEVVHKPDYKKAEVEGASIRFRTMCQECGTVVCFADDSTYSVSRTDEDMLTETIARNFKTMSEYLGHQKLSVNEDKTHMMLMTTRQKRKHIREEVNIQTGKENDVFRSDRVAEAATSAGR